MGCVLHTPKPKRKEVSIEIADEHDEIKEFKLSMSLQEASLKTLSLAGFQISAGDFVRHRTTKFKDDYIVKEQLGHGAFGEVRKAIHKATKLVRAVKIMRKDEIDIHQQNKLISEVQILIALDHPNILKIYEMFEDNKNYYVVSEFLEGGELYEKILSAGNLSEKEAAPIMKQLLSAISYSHQHSIVHRDLKLQNLVYESKKKNSNLRVIDFGTAKIFNPGQKMNEKKGTPHYMAPEVIDQNYTQKCDIWSCGVILYMLLSGGLPFHGGQDEEIMNSIKIGKYNFNARIWSKISNDAKRLIQRMLEYNPDRRCSAQEALDDPWFKKVIEKEEVDNSILSQYLQNLKNFKFESKLQETTWRFLVFYFSTKEEKEKLLKTFKTLDVDSNGQLTKEELKQGFIKVMGLSNEQAEEEACRILKIVDTNNSGSIDYSEFVNATISKSDLLTKERLEAAFKVLDKNGDGKISANEIRLLFNEEKTHDLPQLIWRYWISEVDKNLDGKISLEEFKEMMVSLMSKC